MDLTAKQTVILTAVIEEVDRRRKAKDEVPTPVAVSDWNIGPAVRQTEGFEQAWGRDRGSRQGFIAIANRLHRKGLIQRDLWRRSFWPTEAGYAQVGRRMPTWLERIDERGYLHAPLIRSTEEERTAAEIVLSALSEANVVYYGGIHNGSRNATIKALRRARRAA
jgi:hypothetical protein